MTEINMVNSFVRRCVHVTGAVEGGPHIVTEDPSTAGAV